MIYTWRSVLDEWKKSYGGDTRIMMTEAYANISFTMRYYESEDGKRQGSHIPFNFLMISDLHKDATAQDFVHTIYRWMNYMPAGKTANWVVSDNFFFRFFNTIWEGDIPNFPSDISEYNKRNSQQKE